MSVSVVIPALNATGFIARAIESALSQGQLVHEVIVVDDGSTDNTSETVRQLSTDDDRIRLVNLPRSRGPGVARNTGIAAATGKWIAILDADDRYLEGRLEYLVSNAERYGLDYAADNLMFFDYLANQVTGVGIRPKYIGSILRLDRYDFVSNCMTNRRNRIDFGLLKPIVRRQFICAHQISYPSIRHGEDFAFYFKGILAGGSFALLPKAYYLYTERKGIISGRASELSRTSVDYSAMQQFTFDLGRTPEVREDRRLAKLLRKRARKIGDLCVKNELLDHWHHGRYATLGLLLCTKPKATMSFVSIVKAKVIYRLGQSARLRTSN
jgi:succinoglycan biosynthesis protein ExoO